jgi:ATP-dependent Clp protease, protease subunit
MRDAVRVIEGSAKPGEAFWRMIDAAQSESGEAEVEFFGPISEYSWFGDEVTPKAFKDELYKVGKSRPVTVKVNSPGGEVFAAAAIRAILQDYPARVTADIIGLAASAATIVVGGAKVVKMRDTATFMIHDPSTIAWGTIDEMQQVVDILKTVKETILNGYEAKTGMNREMLSQLMRDETWMTAQQAKELGFVDEVINGEKPKTTPKNLRAVFVNCLRNYTNVPADVVAALSAPLQPPEGARSVGAEAAEQMQDEAVIPAEEPASAGDAADNKTNQDAEAALRERVQIILKEKKS